MLNYFDNKYPYTDFHEMNLDWLLQKVQLMGIKLDTFVSLNTIKYANPIAWDITTQYEANTVVIDQNTGVAYISSQPVPVGVSLSNTDYWSVIFNLEHIIGNITENITFNDNGQSDTLLTDAIKDDWLLWNNKLYVVLHDMSAGTALIIDSNIRRATIEDLTRMTYYETDETLEVVAHYDGTQSILSHGDIHVYDAADNAIRIISVD